MGGSKARLVRQRDRGRLNARERLAHLFDPDTFFEIGNLVGTTDQPPVPGDALVAGSGASTAGLRLPAPRASPCSVDPSGVARPTSAIACASTLQERVPLVMMLEGAARPPGHRVGVRAPARRPDGLGRYAGTVPMVCLVLGASAGHGALTAPLCDFVVMTETAWYRGRPAAREVGHRRTSRRRCSAGLKWPPTCRAWAQRGERRRGDLPRGTTSVTSRLRRGRDLPPRPRRT